MSQRLHILFVCILSHFLLLYFKICINTSANSLRIFFMTFFIYGILLYPVWSIFSHNFWRKLIRFLPLFKNLFKKKLSIRSMILLTFRAMRFLPHISTKWVIFLFCLSYRKGKTCIYVLESPADRVEQSKFLYCKLVLEYFPSQI